MRLSAKLTVKAIRFWREIGRARYTRERKNSALVPPGSGFEIASIITLEYSEFFTLFKGEGRGFTLARYCAKFWLKEEYK